MIMLEELQLIKEQLFDAPSEVKEAFNAVVGYFDNNDKGPFLVVRTPRPSFKYYFKVVTESNFINHNKKAEASQMSKGQHLIKFIKIAGPFKTKEEADKKKSELEKSSNTPEEIEKRRRA